MKKEPPSGTTEAPNDAVHQSNISTNLEGDTGVKKEVWPGSNVHLSRSYLSGVLTLARRYCKNEKFKGSISDRVFYLLIQKYYGPKILGLNYAGNGSTKIASPRVLEALKNYAEQYGPLSKPEIDVFFSVKKNEQRKEHQKTKTGRFSASHVKKKKKVASVATIDNIEAVDATQNGQEQAPPVVAAHPHINSHLVRSYNNMPPHPMDQSPTSSQSGSPKLTSSAMPQRRSSSSSTSSDVPNIPHTSNGNVAPSDASSFTAGDQNRNVLTNLVSAPPRTSTPMHNPPLSIPSSIPPIPNNITPIPTVPNNIPPIPTVPNNIPPIPTVPNNILPIPNNIPPIPTVPNNIPPTHIPNYIPPTHVPYNIPPTHVPNNIPPTHVPYNIPPTHVPNNNLHSYLHYPNFNDVNSGNVQHPSEFPNPQYPQFLNSQSHVYTA